MNNKKNIFISNIEDATNAHRKWLNEARLLLNGESIQSVQEPVSCTECDFGLWFYSQSQSLSVFPWFIDADLLHQNFHTAYSAIYDEAQRIHNPTSKDVLEGYFDELENKSDLLVEKLEHIKKTLNDMPDSFFDDSFGGDIAIKKVKPETNEIINFEGKSDPIISTSFNVKHEELRLKLMQQDVKQMQQEQKFIEQDLEQNKDRCKLIQEGIQQLSQYRELKQEELDDILITYEGIEAQKTELKEALNKDISGLSQGILMKLTEIKKLGTLDEKLERRKKEEMDDEMQILAEFENHNLTQEEDLSQLNRQRQEWQKEVDSLKQQLSLIEQDIASLDKQCEEKKSLIENANDVKNQKLQALQERSEQQQALDDKRSTVINSIQKELENLELSQSEKQEDLSQLEFNIANVKREKSEKQKKHEDALNDLDAQKHFKESKIEALEKDKQRKQQELESLVEQQEKINLELECTKDNVEEKLEAV